jgi:hypothetical protein
MPDERRNRPRITGPFDGSWNGAAGIRNCRIVDISAAGCFIDAISQPEVGAEVVVSVVLAGREFALPGRAVHVDRVQGFGVRFADSEAATQLAAVLDAM